ncbi:MAG: tyrosine-type recombinase/integrase [Chloroflexi bacterium]|nr:tyrosine-type recombinase/integrase [Chloroflexota bacterium]
MIRHHRADQAEHVLGSGGAYEDQDLVFAGVLGGPIDPEHLTHGFKKIAKSAGYPGTRLHDLRHAHAASLFKAGIHPRVVQERLGHSSAAFTMQVYGHVMARMQEQAGKDFADLLAR